MGSLSASKFRTGSGLVAIALSSRKRIAWWIATIYLVLFMVSNALLLVDPVATDFGVDTDERIQIWIGLGIDAAALIFLIVTYRQFYTRVRRGALFRALGVLIVGLTAATLVVHLASVAIGFWIGEAFADYQSWIAIGAGIAFLIFGAWTLRGDELTEEEASKARKATGTALLAVGTAFFLAELGDKTMLATITLATREGWFGTWIGSTLGMVLADALAIAPYFGGELGSPKAADEVAAWVAAQLELAELDASRNRMARSARVS